MANVLKSIIIDMKKTVGDTLLLLGVRPLMSFTEGVKGGQEGLTFTCLSELLGYEKLDIKVVGILQLPFEFDGSPMMVEFEGLEGKLWQDWNNKGEVRLSVTAKGIRPLDEKKIKMNLGGNKT